MSRAATSALRDGVILNNRYRIVKQIGRGGFGRAYLAEDAHRYRELCVLKEFAPQIAGSDELGQAEDLFEREAGILYRLNHQQIPRFEALLRTRINGRRSLFLVQEYILGESYWELLQRYGKLTEAEVTEMIRDILPVLDYIHSTDLIHRDISPDNLILREVDGKPVLIDFGCVKLAANAVSQSRGHSVTLIGKKGYAPDEQIRRGQTMPCSDLYALGATAVVLLTGKQPDKLYDHHGGKWLWRQVEVSFRLQKILQKMLAERPCDRYQSVEQLRQALGKEDNSMFTGFMSRFRTLIVAPRDKSSSHSSSSHCVTAKADSAIPRLASDISNIPSPLTRMLTTADLRRVKPWQWGMIASGIIIIPGLISFILMNYRITRTIAFDFDPNGADLTLSQKEQDFQRQIQQRLESLDIDSSAFYKQVDTLFYDRHPELAGEPLTESSKHQQYRQDWYQIASSLLAKQERRR